jgi:hypothetical protein
MGPYRWGGPDQWMVETARQKAQLGISVTVKLGHLLVPRHCYVTDAGENAPAVVAYSTENGSSSARSSSSASRTDPLSEPANWGNPDPGRAAVRR